MLTIDLTHLHNISTAHGVSKKELHAMKKKLPTMLQQFYTREQHWHEIIDDTKTIRDIKTFVKNKKKYNDIVVLGIGGSALGTKCLRHVLSHVFDHEMQNKNPRLHVLDNIDPVLMQEIEDIIDISKTLFIVVSKSGTTPETMSQFLYFSKKIKAKKLRLADHVVCITGTKNSILKDIADKEKLPVFPHAEVGGRFAVLSSVGLLPAAYIGIDIDALLRGARDMRKKFLSNKWDENVVYQLASAQYLLYGKGVHNFVMMPYAQKLVYLADWYRQLLAESIGKMVDRNGKKVHVGITPISALGVTDQHSQSQLYNEGPFDKLIMFIAVKKLAKKISIPFSYNIDALDYIKGRSFNELIDAERRATTQAVTKYDRANITIEIDKIDAYHLGQLFMLFEGVTAFLGEMFNIDAYNQPGVELAKKMTRDILKK